MAIRVSRSGIARYFVKFKYCMEHGQEDSFSKAGVHSDEYLNLSRIEQAERPARDLIQPPTGRQQPPAVNRPAFEWSVPQSPSMYVQQTPIQP